MSSHIINTDNLSEIIKQSDDIFSNLYGENIQEFPVDNIVAGNLYIFNNEIYRSIISKNEHLDEPDNSFEKVNVNTLIKNSVIDTPNDKLYGMIDFSNGSFEYWFKDNNIKIKDIDKIINSGAGIVNSETNTLSGRVLENNFYIGKSYVVQDIPNTQFHGNIENLRDGSIKVTINNDGAYHVGGLFWGEHIDNNAYMYLEIECEKDILCENFGSGSSSSDFIRLNNRYIYIKKWNNVDNTGYSQFGTKNNALIGDYFIITKRMFINGISEELEYAPVGSVINEGKLSIKFLNSIDDKYTIILIAKDNNSKYSRSYYSPYTITYDNGYTETLYVNYEEKNGYQIMSGTYGGFFVGEDGTNDYFEQDGYIDFCFNSENHFNNIQKILIYKNLNDNEFYQEINKNIICPKNNIKYPVPDYKGYDNLSYGTYTSLDIDFPLIPDSFYQIISKEGTFNCLISPYGAFLGDQKIKNVSGKIRVKDITVPYKLRILRNSGEWGYKKIKDCTRYMEKNFPDTFRTLTEVTKDMIPDTSDAISLNNFYNGCNKLKKSIKLDGRNALNLADVYYACYELEEEIEINAIKTTTLLRFATSAKKITKVTFLNDTPNVIEISGLFSSCTNLKEVIGLTTNKCKFFSTSFDGCENIISIPPIDLSSITSENILVDGRMKWMLRNCNSLPSVTFNNVPVGVTEEQLRTTISAPSSCQIIINYREEETS